MKAVLLFVAFAIIAAPKCPAQGTVLFANNVASRVYWQPDGGLPTWVPVGSLFTAELVFAPDGTPGTEFDYVAVRVGATTTFGPSAGLFSGGGRTVLNISPAGGFGFFQVRVWETAAGSSYQEAIGRTCNFGTSSILRVDTGDPTTSPPGNPAPLTAYGLASFTLMQVGPPCPEPSTYALGALAVAALLLFRRKKRT